MEQSVKQVLDEAVERFCNGERQSDDIIFATVSSAISTDSLRQGDEVELSQFRLSNPPISWKVKLQVGAGDVVRVVLGELFARDLARLRVQGTIHFRRHGDDGEADDEASREDSNASTCSSASQTNHPLRRRGPSGPVVVVTDRPVTIASVHLSTVAQVSAVMASFYFHPGAVRREDGEDGDGQEGRAIDDCDEVSLQMLGRLSADFGHLLSTQEAADVLLHLGGGELPVKAHRAVLVARSEAFRQMLEDGAAHRDDDMAATMQGLRISDAPRNAFVKVLQYMYTADVAELAGCEMDVLVLAARFGLADLADECCRRLLAALDDDKDLALDLLAFAEQHGVAALKERALLVVVEHLGEVTATARWRDFKLRIPSLAADLLETAARVLVLRKPT